MSVYGYSMTLNICERGEEAVIYATFVTTTGEAASIVGTPTISLYHYKAEGTITDVSAEDMTTLTGTTYYYKHFFPANADKGNYVAKFAATYDTGEAVIGEQEIIVVNKGYYEGATKLTGGVVKTINKDTWKPQEKKEMLDSLVKFKESMDELKSLTASIQKPDNKLDTKLSEVEANIKNEMDKLPKPEKIELTPLLDEIKSVKEDGAKRENQIKSVITELGDMKESHSELVSLMLKMLPSEEIDAVLMEADND
jgi:hypothetical protein